MSAIVKDPYYPAFYEGRCDEEAYREYFSSIMDNLEAFPDFDVYGHLDYVVRYGKTKDAEYSYQKYQDVIDPVLEKIIDLGKGIELNTGAIRHGLKELNPCNVDFRGVTGSLEERSLPLDQMPTNQSILQMVLTVRQRF